MSKKPAESPTNSPQGQDSAPEAGEDNSAPEAPSEPTATGPATAPETPVEAPETPVEPESATSDLDALKAENDALKAQVQRLRVAAEKGVPPELLTATDEDGLQAQAAALLAFAASRSGVPDFGAGSRGNNDHVVVDPIRQALGR